MKKLLIQASNLDTVIDIVMYIYLHPNCSKQDIADYCGFTLRQADYYCNACMYLDLIDKRLKPSQLTTDYFTKTPAQITERVYERIIDDEVMGIIYKHVKDDENIDHLQYAKSIVQEAFPGYSEAVYNRRANNIINWCKQIARNQHNKD